MRPWRGSSLVPPPGRRTATADRRARMACPHGGTAATPAGGRRGTRARIPLPAGRFPPAPGRQLQPWARSPGIPFLGHHEPGGCCGTGGGGRHRLGVVGAHGLLRDSSATTWRARPGGGAPSGPGRRGRRRARCDLPRDAAEEGPAPRPRAAPPVGPTPAPQRQGRLPRLTPSPNRSGSMTTVEAVMTTAWSEPPMQRVRPRPGRARRGGRPPPPPPPPPPRPGRVAGRTLSWWQRPRERHRPEPDHRWGR
jgi:hypothetical protein